MSQHFISTQDAQNDLLACAAYLAENIKSGDGRGEAMSTVIPRYLAQGNVDLSAELANSVDDPFTRDRLLILVAEKCAELDDDEYAMQLADAIEEFGMQSQARERIALQKAAKGQFEKSRGIADQMPYPDGVLGGIAAKQMADGDESGALGTLRQIDFPQSKVSSLQSMSVTKIVAGENEKAAGLLVEAVKAAEEIGHTEEKVRTMCDIAELFIEAGRNDRAVETFEKAHCIAETLDNMHRDSALAAVSIGFLHSGSIDIADRTLDSVADKTQIASCLLAFARDYWKKEERDDAVEALEESYAILKSQREIETRDSKARIGLFTHIAAQFAGFGKSERAIEIAVEIPDENQSVAALSQIAQILTIQKEDDLARTALRAIPDDANRSFALIGMSDAANQNGERDKAIALIEEAAVYAQTIRQLPARSSALNEIARRFYDLGETAKAQDIAQLNLEAIAAIRDESTRVAMLANLADVYAESGFELSDVERQTIAAMIAKS